MSEPLLKCAGRNWVGSLAFARLEGAEGEFGWRCARRYGWGESFANVSLGNERVGWAVLAIVPGCWVLNLPV